MSNYLIDRLLSPRETSDATFLVLPDDARMNYRDFASAVNRVANCLVAGGLNPGDRVAARVPKSWRTLALYLGTVKAGGVFLPLNTAYTTGEVRYFVENAAPHLLVCEPESAAALAPLMDASETGGVMTLDREGGGSLAEAAEACSDRFEAVARGPGDLASILYTSGTTGRSKGAMLTHDNLWSNAEVLAGLWEFGSGDVLLHALPVFHTHGLFVACNVLMLAGGSMIFLPAFDLDEMIRRLPEATSMMGVPTFYTRLLDDSRFDSERVRHMRLFVSGSAPMLVETHRSFEQRTGHRILERYGMTETGMNTSNPYHGERRVGTVGPALPGIEVRVVDAETGAPMPCGEVGMIQVSGPNVFAGYWRMPEKTAEEFTADGFFITGDLGSLSEDNYLTIVGRGKDLIISGGYNIYPKEVELVLDELAGVGESAVIGVPHPDFGEGVVAVLTGESPPTEAEIRELVADRLARFKQPRKVFHIESLPRNSMGKVQKNVLRELYGDAFV